MKSGNKVMRINLRSRSVLAAIALSVAAAGCKKIETGAGVMMTPKGRYVLTEIGGQRVPHDTTRVGKYVVAETLVLANSGQGALVTQTLLVRGINNRRMVVVDSHQFSVRSVAGCAALRLGDTQAEEESRRAMRALQEEQRQRIRESTGVTIDQALRDGPYSLSVAGTDIIIDDDKCSSSKDRRRYRLIDSLTPPASH